MAIVKKVKVTKKELKRDRFIETVLNLYNWGKVNWKYLFIGFSGLILVIIIFLSFRSSFNVKEKNSQLEMTATLDIYVSGDFKQALELFTNIKQAFYGTNASKMSNYYIGMCNLNLAAMQQNPEQNYNDAIKSFKQFLKFKIGLDELKSAAYIGIAKSFEGLNQIDSAFVYYNYAIDKVPTNAYTPEAYLGLGRYYEAKFQVEEALNTYEKIIYLFKNTTYAQQALVYKNLLEGAIDPLTQIYGKQVQKEVKNK